MINLIYDIDGCKVGVYDGDNDSASIYDCAGHYLGKYFEHEIFNKEGMCLGFHNGNPLETLKILVLYYYVYKVSAQPRYTTLSENEESDAFRVTRRSNTS